MAKLTIEIQVITVWYIKPLIWLVSVLCSIPIMKLKIDGRSETTCLADYLGPKSLDQDTIKPNTP
jgi:hypothetical protein